MSDDNLKLAEGFEYWHVGRDRLVRQEPPKKPRKGKLSKALAKYDIKPNKEVSLTYSQGMEILQSEVNELIGWVDTVKKLTDLVVSAHGFSDDLLVPHSSMPALTELMANVNSMEEIDVDWKHDTLGKLKEHILTTIKEYPTDTADGLIESGSSSYDHKRGWGEVNATLKIKAENVLKWGAVLEDQLKGWKATFKDGRASIEVEL